MGVPSKPCLEVRLPKIHFAARSSLDIADPTRSALFVQSDETDTEMCGGLLSSQKIVHADSSFWASADIGTPSASAMQRAVVSLHDFPLRKAVIDDLEIPDFSASSAVPIS